MQETAPTRVRIGAFELDLKAGELRKGEHLVRLQEQPFQILLMLVERAGELVTREEIKKKLWPNDTVVEFDHSIHTAIAKLRQALGDSAESPKYVETVARRGYRLMAPVEWAVAVPSLSPEAGEKAGAPVAQVPAELQPTVLTGRTVSHYRVLGIIGGGGMGVVYRAEDLKLGRQVALKFLPEELGSEPQALERFSREARAASSLDHPNICPIYEFGEHEGRPFIVMQLLEGQTLRDRLAVDEPPKPLPAEELLDIGIQVSEGLRAAHEKGIIHRDIKPANIFLTSKGVVKILDFGLAKLVEAPDFGPNHKGLVSGHDFSSAGQAPFSLSSRAEVAAAATGVEGPVFVPPLENAGPSTTRPPVPQKTRVGEERRHSAQDDSAKGIGGAAEAAPLRTAISLDAALTRTGLAMGTAGYMSPEQVRGERLDARTDIFSFGLVLYEMATGQRAFTGQTAAVVHDAILNSTPVPIRDLNSILPAKLVATIDKALEKDREQRYQSATEMGSDLRRTQSRAVREVPKAKVLRSVPLVLGALVLCAAGVLFVRSRWRTQGAAKEPLVRQLTPTLLDSPALEGVAISPDGKHLAYLDGTRGVAVLQIDSGEGRSFATDTAFRRVTWSPDGDHLLLSKAGETGIWKASVLDGKIEKVQSETLLPIASPDGKYVAYLKGEYEIWIANADGGAAHKLLSESANLAPHRLLSEGETLLDHIAWAPDSKRIAYETYRELRRDEPKKSASGLELKLKSCDLNGQCSTILSDSKLWANQPTSLIWLADGRLIFSFAEPPPNENTTNLWSLQVDPDTGKVLGEPKRLTSWTGFQQFHLTASTDGKRLAFQRIHVERTVKLLPLRTGQQSSTTAPPLSMVTSESRAEGWTNDSESVLFTAIRYGKRGVFAQKLNENTPRTLVSGGIRYGNPVLTSDGQFLLYTERLADGTAQVMRMPFSGGPSTKLLSGEYRYQCASTASNECIASRVESSNQLAFFWLDPLRGRGEELSRIEVVEGSAYDWGLSPDGQVIALADNVIGLRQIRIFDLHGGSRRTVVVSGSPQCVRWAPDGYHLYVSGSDKWILGQIPNRFGIYEVDLASRVKVLLEMQPFQGRLSEPIPSPDGRYLIYTEQTWPSNVTMLENF